MTMRDEFEIWLLRDHPNADLRKSAIGGYMHGPIQNRWEAWQAAYQAGEQAMREKAAMWHNNNGKKCGVPMEYWHNRNAEAIRALSLD